MNITIEEQIKCVKREIAMRERVYPREVRYEKMSQETADKEIASMRAVLKTLLNVVPADGLFGKGSE